MNIFFPQIDKYMFHVSDQSGKNSRWNAVNFFLVQTDQQTAQLKTKNNHANQLFAGKLCSLTYDLLKYRQILIPSKECG